MALGEEFLSELRMRTDIENLISSYVVLKRRGKTLVGLCPFHNEKTPSFTVYPESQSFYCFGCGSGGDAVTFLRKIENLDYIDAVKALADKAGMTMPDEGGYDKTISDKRRRILEANRAAARYFHSCLMAPEGREALEYLLRRGLTKKTIASFGLGFAPNSWHSLIDHMRSLGFTRQELVSANLANESIKNDRKNVYDNFRNRLMFPVIDIRGNVVAFGGRVLDDSKPKYINTSDTLVYKKGQGIFALNLAKNGNSERKLILAEGYMDVIALHQAGFTNAVACLGTALTKEQAGIIARYADEVILSYDNDGAGQAAANRAIQIFSKTGIKIRVLSLSGGKDPDEIIKNHGPERFRALLQGAANDTEYKILKARNKYDVSTDDGKVSFLNEATDVLSFISNSIEREVYASRLSGELNISKEAILREAERKYKANRRKSEKAQFRQIQRDSQPSNDPINPDRAKSPLGAKAEDILLATIMKNPDFLEKIDDIQPEEFITSFNARVFAFLRDRIKQNLPLDLSYFSGSFTPEEMGRIALLQTMSFTVSNTVAECSDCIKTIRREKANMIKVDPAGASDEEFLKLFQNKTKDT